MESHGASAQTFYLHLKECELGFNYREDDISAAILKVIRENPLS